MHITTVMSATRFKHLGVVLHLIALLRGISDRNNFREESCCSFFVLLAVASEMLTSSKSDFEVPVVY